ncbi:MAG: alternative ribosome rescue aminoacyl-tRNA hydrolase ArfB [Candidatus Binatia bacterium]
MLGRSPERGGLLLVVGDKVRIPLREIGFRFVRSSGPGGQNINKVASKAVLRWSAATSPSVASDVRGRFLARFAARITSEGDLVLACDRHRERERNRDDCLERLRQMLAAVIAPPKPRRKTRAPRAAAERRLRDKRMRAVKKQHRRTLD